jgi:hypothetical protein
MEGREAGDEGEGIDPTDVKCTNFSQTYSASLNPTTTNTLSLTLCLHSPHFPPFPRLKTVQLLHKLKVRSADGKATLLKVIKNPITRHLPAGCKCYGFSVQGTLYNPSSLACVLPEDKSVVFVLGAMAAGHITVNDHPYVRGGKDAKGRLVGEEEERHEGRAGGLEGNQAPMVCFVYLLGG